MFCKLNLFETSVKKRITPQKKDVYHIDTIIDLQDYLQNFALFMFLLMREHQYQIMFLNMILTILE